MGWRVGKYWERLLVVVGSVGIFFVGFGLSINVLAARDLAKKNLENIPVKETAYDRTSSSGEGPLSSSSEASRGRENENTDAMKRTEDLIPDEGLKATDIYNWDMVVGNSAVTGADNVQINEEFDGNSLNSGLWEAMTYPRGYRNNEEQEYLPSQVKVSDGNLQITAERDTQGKWKSGVVESKWAYKYGDFEVRMKLSDTGQGVWPAAWLMGRGAEWPTNGEIDIVENLNGNNLVYGTIHGGGSMYHWQLQHSHSPIDVRQYHTYKVVKQPGRISWWIDGIKRGEWTKSQVPKGGEWPFEEYRYYSLLNLAMGGIWPGPTTDSTPGKVTMYIESFKVTNAH